VIRRLLPAALLLLAAPAAAAAAPSLVAFDGGHGASLADAGGIARIETAAGDHEVVRIAAADLAADLARVSGRSGTNGTRILLGTLGRNPAIDALVASGRLDVRRLRGAWESFLIAPVGGTLVVVGSDRRGTAYGGYELSRAIGVSPWHWWADVAPERHPTIRVAPGARRFGPPSVRYRGIFLNDEDWGLEPWARLTHEPEAGTIGPKTYARLFELMLRLKANLVWPAMHKVTRPFNADPANAALADRYAIVMGSSHAEPMLRNNVGEWTAPAAAFNYLTNPTDVGAYWRERVATNGRYENVWTLGMRGIHDSGIVGPTTDDGRRDLLNRIIADQRRMLPAGAPQVFTPYKEVLGLYRAGLNVPPDVTLMWPDDNFGYIRQLPDAAERVRPGGSGVYYHLSYLGAPLSYLWLSTTPPALIREEMGRAWDAGARQMWVANVGDLKPAELATDYFLDLAWNIGRRTRTIDAWTADWAALNLGRDVASEVALILAEHHRLNFARRPEHLQWWLPGELSRPSPLPPAEVEARLAAFAAVGNSVRALAPRIAPDRQDAFFELVDYPVTAAAMANVRVFEAERHDRLRDGDPTAAAGSALRADDADRRIAALTRRFNQDIAGGKWRGMMAVEPADGQWRRFRLTPPILPPLFPSCTACVGVDDGTRPAGATRSPWTPAQVHDSAATGQAVVLEAETATGSGWRRVDGLGRNGAAVAAASPATLRYAVALPPGRWRAVAEVLPTYPAGGRPLALALRIDGAAPTRAAAERRTGDPAWARAVLDNHVDLAFDAPLTPGRHDLALTLADPAIILDRIRFDPLP